MTSPFETQNIEILEETSTSTIGGQNSIEIIEETALIEIIDAGFQGPRGASSYEIAVALGFVGTEAQWLTSLQGNANVLILQPNEIFDPSTPPDTAVFRYRA